MNLQIREGIKYVTNDGVCFGPMVAEGSVFVVERGDGFSWGADGRNFNAGSGRHGSYDLVAEWVDPEAGPVRTETVTRMVIVPGEYGRVGVTPHVSGDMVGVSLTQYAGGYAMMSSEALRAAARVFNSLAEALEH